MELDRPATWSDGSVDGVVRDIRRPIPDDGLLSGVVARMGDERSGPVLAMSIEGRRFPRKAPVHLHKSDSFRMALGNPIVVGRHSYAHGEFRVQEADSFYGPELWDDDIGTNQLLFVADRRGLKPYLVDATAQRYVDEALVDDVDLAGVEMLDRDAVVVPAIASGFGVAVHAGHFDAGFAMTGGWPALPDGTRLGVVALGDPVSGPLVLAWDRPPTACDLPAFESGADLARLVVDGSGHIGAREVGRLAFRLQQAGTVCAPSAVGPGGIRELWLLADRRRRPRWRAGAATTPATEVLGAIDDLLTVTLPVAT